MRLKPKLFVVDTHTEGEPTRIILHGFPDLQGDDIPEKREYMRKNLDHLRTATLLEPRGHDNQFGALVSRTGEGDANFELIFMDNRGYLDMCGHGTIGVTTALIDLGIVQPSEPYTKVSFMTVAGHVEVKAKVCDGEVEEVQLTDVPSFHVGDFDLKMEGGESIPVDVAYGGNFYVIAEAHRLNLKVRKEHIAELIEKGIKLRDEAAKQIEVHHPEKPDVPQKIDLAMITDEPELTGSDGKNIVVFGNGQFDRSPCGTGTAARVSTLYSKGLLKLGEKYIHESVINTRFTARILRTVKVGGLNAVVPEITGRAFITQIAYILFDERDPLKNGFSTM